MGIVLNFDENEVTKASVAMHVLISVHRRMRQEAYPEVKASLWATLQKPCLTINEQTTVGGRNTNKWVLFFIEVLFILMS